MLASSAKTLDGTRRRLHHAPGPVKAGRRWPTATRPEIVTMRIASIQVAIRRRPKDEMLRHVLALLDQARGSDLILLPELWPCGYFAFERYASDSETIDGPTTRELSA